MTTWGGIAVRLAVGRRLDLILRAVPPDALASPIQPCARQTTYRRGVGASGATEDSAAGPDPRHPAMTSTFLDYRLYAQDLSKALARTQARPEVARDAAYYRENIGKIASVDAFLEDRRLFAFAMKAHGLEDMTYAKAFMRKVLESDLNDEKSFVRRLVDTRYIEFARAFRFGTDGGVRQNLPFAQNEYQQDDTVGLYSEHRVKQGISAAAEAQYFQSKIPTLASVDELIGDKRLFAYALTAFGIESRYASAAAIRNVLTSDLSDPASVANQMGLRYRALAAAFSFATDGSVTGGAGAQTAAQLEETVYLHYENSGNGATAGAAAHKTQYYNSSIGTVASVDDLLGNDRLFAYALTAFGINPDTASKSAIRQVLVSDLSDPGSFANAIADTRFRTLAAAFNFGTDGSVVGSDGAQSSDQLEDTTTRYLETYDDAAVAAEASTTNLYRSRIGFMTSVDSLIDNELLYNYVLNAFGLDPKVESKGKIRQVLISDLSNPASFANLQRDPKYRELAAAFNFGPDGGVLQPPEAQTDAEELATIQLYNTRVGTSASEEAAAKDENLYYHGAIARVRSLDAFLADKRLVAYALKAYGLEGAGIGDSTLRAVLTSDPLDQDGDFERRFGDPRLRDLAAAFNFTADGGIGRGPTQQAQLRSSILDTTDAYLRQTMETDAGAQNAGVRLALYFQRKAASVDSAFDILADKALFEVVRTSLGLPVQMSQAEIETQAAIITRRLDIADFQDPQKVEKFLSRFSALYDLANGTSSTSSPASIILGGGTASLGTDTGLLASLQRIVTGQG
jgi:Protein of unknown function (DUF1217)